MEKWGQWREVEEKEDDNDDDDFMMIRNPSLCVVWHALAAYFSSNPTNYFLVDLHFILLVSFETFKVL